MAALNDRSNPARALADVFLTVYALTTEALTTEVLRVEGFY